MKTARVPGVVAAIVASGSPVAVLAVCAAVLVLLLGLTACGTLRPQADQPTSRALSPAAGDPLVRVARESVPEPAASGCRLMALGLYSLGARIELIERAQS